MLVLRLFKDALFRMSCTLYIGDYTFHGPSADWGFSIPDAAALKRARA